jgi:MarR family transcriptional regulator for hemolysin
MKYTRDETTPWLVYKARHLLKKRIQNKLKDYDISSEQWSVLNTVYMKKGCNQITLAEILLKDGATITRILNILENKKLVRREKSTHDKREYLIYLTEYGINLYNKALPVVVQNTKETDSIFSDSELKELHYLLNKLVLSLE